MWVCGVFFIIFVSIIVFVCVVGWVGVVQLVVVVFARRCVCFLLSFGAAEEGV